MRLINTHTLKLEEFYNEDAPPYAILSHAWGNEEVKFEEWQDCQQASLKQGYSKILKACEEALKHNLKWLWVDTNCIDKRSSAELSEAINSMFAYYQNSEVCLAYLADVDTSCQSEDILHSKIEKSRWFTRGWTLQELIAPKKLIFYAADWSQIGRNDGSLTSLLTSITQIRGGYLEGQLSIHKASVAERMSWLAKRTTTRIEDMAYCMLGIFNINMPLLYGEGKKAFFRLQEEIIRNNNDHSLFCWEWNKDVPNDWGSLLAPWPTVFEAAGNFCPVLGDQISVYSITNGGLSIQLPAMGSPESTDWEDRIWVVMLQATWRGSIAGLHKHRRVACLRVVGRRLGDILYVSRFSFPPQPMCISATHLRELRNEQLIVTKDCRRAGIEPPVNRITPNFTDERTIHFMPIIYDNAFLESSSKTTWQSLYLHGEDPRIDSASGMITTVIHGGALGVSAIRITPGKSRNAYSRFGGELFDVLFGVSMENDSCEVSVVVGRVDRDEDHGTFKFRTKMNNELGRRRFDPIPDLRSDDWGGFLRQWFQQVKPGSFTTPFLYGNPPSLKTVALERAIDVMRGSKSYYFLFLYDGNRINALCPREAEG
ncbi:heterokaryon incompatibility protein het-E-1 [Fusarium pseudoanthophilum]|uniref:Heterokaryon incompatibility protein het-E-1 n=1 Tax=Fusarium pseudoanthophilum TaxID=48495 RepID=A0A8H5V263_9HYPO|nr:heterokaryon incompatibility protein het-E-1 [Fusarium pseudoanthophilum]